MITKHRNCPTCNGRAMTIGDRKVDVRTALRKHAKIPTQRNRDMVAAAQEQLREAVRMLQEHVSEGVSA
jgi:hypothetical protein